ncbi:MAG: tetratricopeptide repeat protein [Candidatus Thermoplasmatota archaeon]|nr:tetratricopeptide repeat protein [Candidatus Thermoplasmatota archaeon]
MVKDGLGKGLNALISSKGKAVTKGKNGYLIIKEKEKEIEDLDVRLLEKKTEIEELRRDLTIELMLKGKVDKTELWAIEEEIDSLVKEKNGLTEQLHDLKGEMQFDTGIPMMASKSGKDQIDINEIIAETISGEIDMRMVRELMPGNGGVDNDVVGTGADMDIEKTEVYEEIEVHDKEHMKKLREELDRNRVVDEVRKEAYGDQEGKRLPILVRKRKVLSPAPEQVPASGPSPVNMVAPMRRITKRVVVRKVPMKTDKEVFSIIKNALFLVQSGSYEDAKELLENAMKDDPSNDEILYHLGNVYFLQDDLETAEFLFKRSINKNSESYRAYNNLGVVQRKLGKKESAIRALNRSLELEPRYERAWMNLGTLFMEIDPPMLTEALIFLKRALECHPNYRKAREKLELCQQMMEQL